MEQAFTKYLNDMPILNLTDCKHHSSNNFRESLAKMRSWMRSKSECVMWLSTQHMHMLVLTTSLSCKLFILIINIVLHCHNLATPSNYPRRRQVKLVQEVKRALCRGYHNYEYEKVMYWTKTILYVIDNTACVIFVSFASIEILGQCFHCKHVQYHILRLK